MKKIIFLLGLLYCFACENEAVEPPAPPVPKGTFLFHLHNYIDLQEIDLYGIEYQTSEGRSIVLDYTEMYISEIQLLKEDGSLYSIPGKILLKNFRDQTYEVAEVPVGKYKSVHFKVGLPAAVNALAPKDSAILDQPAMWWNSSAQANGYLFMNVQGKIDTSADLSHSPVPFVYKIGTNANYVAVKMPEREFTIKEDTYFYGHIIVDYSQLFKGLALNKASNLSVQTIAENANATAQQIVCNIPSMFIYE
jgi:hypothetical protein